MSYVLMGMADCEEIPGNLDNEVLEAMFKTGKIQTMIPEIMRSVMGQLEHEAYIHKFREEGLAEGRARGLEEGRAKGLAEGRAEALDVWRQTGFRLR